MALNLADIDLADLAPKVVEGLDILIKALTVVEDFSVLLPAGTLPVLQEAVKVLTAVETVASKV